MSGLFATWILRTSQVSRSVTSSLASASGPAPCDSPAGQTTDPSGPALAPASPLAPQASEADLTTSATSGPSCSVLSASAALQSSLASRLQARMALSGSTLYKLTWKERATPAQRQICARRASAHRTSDSGSTGWATPRATDPKCGSTYTENCEGKDLPKDATLAGWPTPNTMTGGRTSRGGDRIGEPLMAGAAQLCGWPTPREADGEKNVRTLDGSLREIERKGSPQDLSMAAVLTGWTTTTTRDWKDTAGDIKPRSDTGRERLDQLPRQANLAGWRTPTCQSPNSLRGNGQDPEKRLAQGHAVNLTDEVNWLKNNPQPARLTVTGEMLTGSTAGMESGGQLNPAHSRWLMGLPPEWDACAPTVTPSSRKSRKPS